ncbi:MAG: hypothetical protein AB1724_01775 [Thermodesulfobacteriota bacterium]
MSIRISAWFRMAVPVALMCLVVITVLTAAEVVPTPGDVLVIETTGTGTVNRENPAAAKQEAVKNALRLAVDEALKTMLPPEVLADHAGEIKAIFSARAEEYVLSYTTLSVTDEGDFCRVKVRASVPAGGVRDRLRKSGISAAMEMPRKQIHVFYIQVRGAEYLSGLHNFRRIIDGMDGITRPLLHEMTADGAVMSVDFPGNARELATTLASAPSDLLVVTVTDVQEDGVVIELRKAGGQ